MEVEATCYRCHAPVSQGKVFCPECRAPQIRVVLPEAPVPQMAPEAVSATQDAVHLPSLFSSLPNRPQGIDWSHGLPAIVLGGIIAAALMLFPLGAFGPAMFAGGALTALFYYHRAPASPLTPGIGARLGVLSGIIGFGILIVFAAVATLLSGTERLRATLLEALNQSASRSTDPQTLKAAEYLKTPEGLMVFLIIGLVFLFLMFLIFSTAGGALGAAWIRRRRRF